MPFSSLQLNIGACRAQGLHRVNADALRQFEDQKLKTKKIQVYKSIDYDDWRRGEQINI